MSNPHAQVPERFDLRGFFREIRTIAVVGYSDNPERAGHYVAHYLLDSGYQVIAVNPKFGPEINGLRCYSSLSDIPAGTQIDVIVVFRSPSLVPAILEQAAQMNPRPAYFVMQPGAESSEASSRAPEFGITPLDICMMAAHKIWK